jgi:hypothetical protein
MLRWSPVLPLRICAGVGGEFVLNRSGYAVASHNGQTTILEPFAARIRASLGLETVFF